MEAKEKADKLYWKFVKIIDPHFGVAIRKDVKQRAIQCAIICVDELINDSEKTLAVIGQINMEGFNRINTVSAIVFWKEVKIELEKMNIPKDVLIIGADEMIRKFCEASALNYETVKKHINDIHEEVRLASLKNDMSNSLESFKELESLASKCQNILPNIKEKSRGVIPPNFYKKYR